uniref:Uncharacterized protein n=1 Tax=Clastoptera arizonana TaxID=38151 RepID=A0A1B6DE76_9HEMI
MKFFSFGHFPMIGITLELLIHVVHSKEDTWPSKSRVILKKQGDWNARENSGDTRFSSQVQQKYSTLHKKFINNERTHGERQDRLQRKNKNYKDQGNEDMYNIKPHDEHILKNGNIEYPGAEYSKSESKLQGKSGLPILNNNKIYKSKKNKYNKKLKNSNIEEASIINDDPTIYTKNKFIKKQLKNKSEKKHYTKTNDDNKQDTVDYNLNGLDEVKGKGKSKKKSISNNNQIRDYNEHDLMEEYLQVTEKYLAYKEECDQLKKKYFMDCHLGDNVDETKFNNHLNLPDQEELGKNIQGITDDKEENEITVEEENNTDDSIQEDSRKNTFDPEMSQGPREVIGQNKNSENLLNDPKTKLVKKYMVVDVTNEDELCNDDTKNKEDINELNVKTFMYIVEEEINGRQIKYTVVEDSEDAYCNFPEEVLLQ